MMKKSLLFLLIPLLFYNCVPREIKGSFNIEGEIVSSEPVFIRLTEIYPKGSRNIDSAWTSKDGRFAFTVNTNERGFFMVQPDSGGFFIVAGPGDMISARLIAAGPADSLEISGSDESQKLNQYFQETEVQSLKINAIVDNFYKDHPDKMALLDSSEKEFWKAMKELKQIAADYLYEDPEKLSNILVLNRMYGKKPLFSFETDLDVFLLVDTALYKKYPDNQHVVAFHERTVNCLKGLHEQFDLEAHLMPGAQAPDFSSLDTSGKKVNLRDFKGKYTLIHFWSSQNKASRITNKQLVHVYGKSMPENLRIIGVSLDEKFIFWKGAIRADRLSWIQLSDLESVHSPVAKLYNIRDTLPYFYFLSPEGKIIEKNASWERIARKMGKELH